MPLIHALRVAAQALPDSAEGMYSVWFDTGASIWPRAARIAMPRPGGAFLTQCGTRWKGASFDFLGSMELLLDGVATGKLMPMAGIAGYAVPPVDPVVAWPQGTHVSWRYLRLAGVSPDYLAAGCVVRPSASGATKARVQLAYRGGLGGFFPAIAPSTRSAIDAAWFGVGGPAGEASGVLVPVPSTLARFHVEVDGNTLLTPATIAVYDDVAAATVTPPAPYTYAALSTGFKDAGPLAIALGAPKVLEIVGTVADATVTNMTNVRATAILTIL